MLAFQGVSVPFAKGRQLLRRLPEFTINGHTLVSVPFAKGRQLLRTIVDVYLPAKVSFSPLREGASITSAAWIEYHQL